MGTVEEGEAGAACRPRGTNENEARRNCNQNELHPFPIPTCNAVCVCSRASFRQTAETEAALEEGAKREREG